MLQYGNAIHATTSGPDGAEIEALVASQNSAVVVDSHEVDALVASNVPLVAAAVVSNK